MQANARAESGAVKKRARRNVNAKKKSKRAVTKSADASPDEKAAAQEALNELEREEAEELAAGRNQVSTPSFMKVAHLRSERSRSGRMPRRCSSPTCADERGRARGEKACAQDTLNELASRSRRGVEGPRPSWSASAAGDGRSRPRSLPLKREVPVVVEFEIGPVDGCAETRALCPASACASAARARWRLPSRAPIRRGCCPSRPPWARSIRYGAAESRRRAPRIALALRRERSGRVNSRPCVVRGRPLCRPVVRDIYRALGRNPLGRIGRYYGHAQEAGSALAAFGLVDRGSLRLHTRIRSCRAATQQARTPHHFSGAKHLQMRRGRAAVVDRAPARRRAHLGAPRRGLGGASCALAARTAGTPFARAGVLRREGVPDAPGMRRQGHEGGGRYAREPREREALPIELELGASLGIVPGNKMAHQLNRSRPGI